MHDYNPNIAIVVLAAGNSSRMGTPKQLLRWGDNNLLTHTVQTAIEVGGIEVIVVVGANNKRIEQEIKHLSVTILNNVNWQDGLGKSIACAAKYVLDSQIQIDGILITLADQPFIEADYLKDIIRNFSANKKCIIATSYGNNKKGVPVLFDKYYFEELSNLSDDDGAKYVLKSNMSSVKTLKTRVKTLDIDSREDYENIYKMKFGPNDN
ncbi:nucleotidyltransferase family protein [Tamlana sp. 2201CG12-4]|uniref:nucleotidyltransferase family protein n=1 Tax=Tamlana sp. 2201CG12-4 TaxID=3112582 RepID=UPI002DBD607F|nr:nucleotidyltransferase family protein [Tamlana sp. 2201CG12-4]MEC3907757.1 nucleotidyltransferase family protein [Tamlana sp. 2201CG12-4]